MNGRAIGSAAAVVVLAVTPLSGVRAAQTERSSAAGVAPVTISGTLTGLSTLTKGGGETRGLLLESGDEVYRVVAREGLSVPAPGTVSTVHGLLTGHTLRATDIDVATTPALTTARQAARSTKVLVLRLYFGSRAPTHPTTAETTKTFVTQSSAWFKAVSRGRYSTTGTVSKWVKVTGYHGCSYDVTSQAYAAARRAGYHPDRYGRVIMYMACSSGGATGQGDMPGSHVWIYGTNTLHVAMHEQGHNLGLDHAESITCKGAHGPTFASGRCQVDEYGDASDAMGGELPGFYSAYDQWKVGWLPRFTSVTGSTTKTIDVYEPKTAGSKALRIAAHGRWYWLEYRSRRGPDSVLYHGAEGVQIRVSPQSKSGRGVIYDASPGGGEYTSFETGEWALDEDRTALQPGSSVTTSEGIRITLIKESASRATIRVKYGAGTEKAPAAPTEVRAVSSSGGALVTWKHPADNGAPVNRYLVTVSPGGTTKTVRSNGGLTTRARFAGLTPGTTYRFTVKAANPVGTGKPTTSNKLTLPVVVPSVVITAPTAGSTISRTVTLAAKATPNAHTKSPIDEVDYYVNGEYVGFDRTAPYSIDWDTEFLDPGAYSIRAQAHDKAGRSAWSPVVKVTLKPPTLTVTLTSTHLTNGQKVSYVSSPAGISIGYAWAYLGTAADPQRFEVGYADDGAPITLSLSGVPAGSYTLLIDAYTADDAALVEGKRSVTV